MTIQKTERIHIALLGRTNVGKSTIVNFISNQDTSIVSNIAGTTTDSVEKVMELHPIGPVVLIDTAGIDDISALGEKRKEKTNATIRKCNFACLVIEPNIWTDYEDGMVNILNQFDIPFAVIINKIDAIIPTNEFINEIASITENTILISAINSVRTTFINALTDIISKKIILNNDINMFDGVLKSGDVCLFVTPIDSGAPKGRMILPQVQALRAILDINAICLFVQPEEYLQGLSTLISPPNLIVTDSQVIKEVIELSPKELNITTFSILLARLKGDFNIEKESANELKNITPTDIILIAEACSHHQQKDDIARVKFPILLEKYLGFKPQIDYCNGLDFPADVSKYKIIIHCGACMISQKEKISRIKIATENNVPITNFGMAISFLNGYLDRVIQPFV
jgi:[FeFe] hydrogenase H-cluster maturation GTPase HydF